MNGRIEELERKVEEISELKDAAENAVAKTQEENQQLLAQIDALTSELETTGNTPDGSGDLLNKRESDLVNARGEIVRLKSEKNAIVEEYEKKIEDMRATRSALDVATENLMFDIQEINSMSSSFGNRKNKLDAIEAALANYVTVYNRELDNADVDYDDLDHELEDIVDDDDDFEEELLESENFDSREEFIEEDDDRAYPEDDETTDDELTEETYEEDEEVDDSEIKPHNGLDHIPSIDVTFTESADDIISRLESESFGASVPSHFDFDQVGDFKGYGIKTEAEEFMNTFEDATSSIEEFSAGHDDLDVDHLSDYDDDLEQFTVEGNMFVTDEDDKEHTNTDDEEDK